MTFKSFNDLSLDLRDQLLMTVPDFLTLRSAVLASRTLHEAFAIRPKSIIRAVVRNEVGPAWPHALSLVRMSAADEVEEPIDEVTVVITAKEALNLGERARVAKRFEDYFSFREKDRTSKISRLSPTESLRFQRALFRFWTLSEVFAHCLYDEEINVPKKLNFLRALRREELFEVDRIWHFLVDIALWTERATSYVPNFMPTLGPQGGYFSITISRTPTQLLQRLEESELEIYITQEFEDDPEAGFQMIDWTSITRQIFTERDIEPASWTKPDQNPVIVENVVGSDDCCHRCNANEGIKLWGEPNYHWLKGYLEIHHLLTLLPGHLSSNTVVREEVWHLMQTAPHFSYPTMLQQMFDGQLEPSHEFVKGQWLCFNCLTAFIRSCLFSWYVRWKVKEGHVFKENCWYGWNCRTQCHRIAHAIKLNHLCEPTKGDEPMLLALGSL